MRLGIFLNFEHGRSEFGDEPSRDAFRAHVDLALKAEACGLEEVWVSEHHFSAFSQSGGFLPILAHLAALTKKVRLGTAALLTPLNDPIRAAEDLATIDLLSDGRLNLGLARGGPFPWQYEHFHILPDDAPARAREASALLVALLTHEDVTFKGRWYQTKGLTTFPRPVQKAMPVYVASYDQATIAEAARLNMHLMAGHAASNATMREMLDRYYVLAGHKPELMVLRNACIADTDAEALAYARPALARFIEGMRALPKGSVSEASVEQALGPALVGSPETCRRKLMELSEAVPITSLVLKFAAIDPKLRAETIARFRSEVLPRESAPLVTAAD
jgi:alkanesulfonate monooxygenase SsuD/methylene tetrahydromethanopterin reductase-like flavin-dependent oxidoreductase (luciferase family)